MKRIYFPVITILVGLSQLAFASTKLVTQDEKSHLEFLAIGRPAMIRIKGEAKGPHGNVDLNDGKVTGKFTLKLDDLSTGIDMRDRHMKEKYLETQKAPVAELSIDNLSLKNLNKVSDVPFEGTLNLHNVSKKVSGIVSMETEGSNKQVDANFKLHLSDFGISIPSYAGLTVADEVQVTLKIELKPE
ncbi:MAG TPA: YceI family protein [Bdellovibrio sp.]|uniref:YceI family protein n=1 Tax=Bdellovibrio sp. TaxID=28201 RepID=UPI002F0800BE